MPLLLLLLSCSDPAPPTPEPVEVPDLPAVVEPSPAAGAGSPDAGAGTVGANGAPSPDAGAPVPAAGVVGTPGADGAPGAPPVTSPAAQGSPAVVAATSAAAPGNPPAAGAAAPGVPAPASAAGPTNVAGAAAPEPVAAPPPATPTRDELDASKSLLYVQVFRDTSTLAAGASHDHVVLATGWSGSVTWQSGDPSRCEIDVRVPVTGLRPDLSEMRKKVGYDVMLTDSQRQQVGEHMLAKGQLDASSFPEMRFQSTACASNADKVTVTGNLSLHGKTRTVTLPMTVSEDGTSFTASGSLSFKGSDFGIAPYEALLGALKNQDGMKLGVSVRSKPR